MQLIQLTSNAYCLSAGTNSGLIVQEKRALLVDTGLDRDSAKKIMKLADGAGIQIVAVAITHAHADHFGGAATLRARLGVPVYASRLEAAIVEHPILEPMYLFSGASPIPDLCHKFTLAEPCVVDGVLEPGDVDIAGIPVRVHAAPGHAPNQVMIGGGEVCFAGDAVFSPDVLAKHGIPFCVDVDQTIETLNAVAGLGDRYATVVPGHGLPTTSVGGWCEANAERLREIRDVVAKVVHEATELPDIIQGVAGGLHIEIPDVVIYLLTQTTVLACLASLYRAGFIKPAVTANRLGWEIA